MVADNRNSGVYIMVASKDQGSIGISRQGWMQVVLCVLA